MPQPLDLSAIRIDGQTQIRVSINAHIVDDYAERMLAGDIFPPVIVVHDGADYWLADGFHRYHGAAKAKATSIRADVRKGTLDDALWLALAANKANGQRLTTADKQKACRLALAKFASHSDRDIAAQIGVDHATVANHRKKLEATGKVKPTPTRTGADGRTTQPGKVFPSVAAYEAAAAEPTATPAEPAATIPPPTDAVGGEIPDHNKLRERYAEGRAVVKALMQAASNLKSVIMDAIEASTKHDPLGQLDKSDMEGDLSHIREHLKFCLPHAVCPVCAGGERGPGAACKQCKGEGWVTQKAYAFIAKEFKA
jgi:hypothetical protein